MKGIGGDPYIDCQNHINVDLLKELNKEICLGIARSDIKAGVYGPGIVESERYGNFMAMKRSMAGTPEWGDMTHNQQNIFAKLYFQLYNPSTVVYLRDHKKGIDPILAYRKKAESDYWEWTDNIRHFTKLNDWLKSLIGTVFTEYGRIIFFIHEHDCKLLTHRDGLASVPHKKEFLWMNPNGVKKFFIYDEEKDTRHYVNTPIAFFNDLDMHGGDSNESMTWSLRIDGVFTEDFRKKLKIDHLDLY